MNEETIVSTDRYREQVRRVLKDFFSQGNLSLATELYWDVFGMLRQLGVSPC